MTELTHTFYVETRDGDDWRDDEYIVSCEVEPYQPGHTSGLPENCYPAEGGYATGYGPVIWIHPDGQEKISWEQFLERWAVARELSGETAIQEAEDEVNDELYQAFIEQDEGRRDDALEHIAESMRERQWIDEMDRRAHQAMEEGRLW